MFTYFVQIFINIKIQNNPDLCPRCELTKAVNTSASGVRDFPKGEGENLIREGNRFFTREARKKDRL